MYLFSDDTIILKMKALNRALLIGIVFILTIGLVGGASASPGHYKYFPETGFSITGEYEAYYNKIADPLFYLGYPISVEMITNPVTLESHQYFQRARLDKVKVNGEDVIEVAPMGSYVLDIIPGVPAELPASAPCRMIKSFRVCYAFEQFYETNKGEVNLGAPVSELRNESGRLVQYFEKARLEWRPEIDAESHVILSDVGKIYMDYLGIDPYDTTPDDAIITRDPKLNENVGPLNVRVFTQDAASIPGSLQTVFVIVQNGDLLGVGDANVTISLTFPDGTPQRLPSATTNANGVAQISFMVPTNLASEDVVQIQAQANKVNGTGRGQGWFRVRR